MKFRNFAIAHVCKTPQPFPLLQFVASGFELFRILSKKSFDDRRGRVVNSGRVLPVGRDDREISNPFCISRMYLQCFWPNQFLLLRVDQRR